MTTTPTVPERTFLLDKRRNRAKWFASLHAETVSSVRRIRDSIAHASKYTLWISFDETLTNALLRSINWPSPSLGHAVLLHRPNLETLPALSDCFNEVAFSLGGGFLPPEELDAVLTAENKRDLFIGGNLDAANRTLTLWRGDLSSLTVPLGAFEPSGNGTQPDFGAFAVTDFGHTIRFGDYEAASDAILYEFDADYRKRRTNERLASERSFGASLRRLRKQRKLRREDFSPLSPKTIARIEQNKVQRLRPRTLGIIAQRLGVSPEEIESY